MGICRVMSPLCNLSGGALFFAFSEMSLGCRLVEYLFRPSDKSSIPFDEMGQSHVSKYVKVFKSLWYCTLYTYVPCQPSALDHPDQLRPSKYQKIFKFSDTVQYAVSIHTSICMSGQFVVRCLKADKTQITNVVTFDISQSQDTVRCQHPASKDNQASSWFVVSSHKTMPVML